GRDTYKLWTAEFNPTSNFEGSWEKGTKIFFTGVNKDGKKEGMMGIIEENIPNQYVSIQFKGMVNDGVEVTEGPEIASWLNSHENYSFSENGGITTVTVEVDVLDKWLDYFNETYPKALERLKQICES